MKNKIVLLVVCMFISLGVKCQESIPETKKDLIKVTILYPNGEGKTFNMDYYSEKHMPMVASLMGEALRLLEIDKGVAGGAPDESIPFLAIGYLYFDTLEAYQNAFGPNAEKIVGDIPNYTNIEPIIQISKVLQ